MEAGSRNITLFRQQLMKGLDKLSVYGWFVMLFSPIPNYFFPYRSSFCSRSNIILLPFLLLLFSKNPADLYKPIVLPPTTESSLAETQVNCLCSNYGFIEITVANQVFTISCPWAYGATLEPNQSYTISAAGNAIETTTVPLNCFL